MGMTEEDYAGQPVLQQAEAGSGSARVINLFTAIPGGKDPDEHDVAAALIVAGAIGFLLLTRRNLSKGSAGHLHISGVDALVVVAYWIVAVAALKTLIARYSSKTWAQSLAWIIS